MRKMEAKVATLEDENRRLRAAADEAAELSSLVKDLQVCRLARFLCTAERQA